MVYISELEERLVTVDPSYKGGGFYVHRAGRLIPHKDYYELYLLGKDEVYQVFEKDQIERLGLSGVQLAFLVTYKEKDKIQLSIVTVALEKRD